jgi:hypothetical protein
MFSLVRSSKCYLTTFLKEGSSNQADEEHQDPGPNNSGYLTQLKRARRSLSGETKQRSVLRFIRNKQFIFFDIYYHINLASIYFSVSLTKYFQLKIVWHNIEHFVRFHRQEPEITESRFATPEVPRLATT